jgi:hypothetical protein
MWRPKLWFGLLTANPKVPGMSWSFLEGLALDWQSNLVKNKSCLEWPICGVEKVKLTYSYTRLGHNLQIGRSLSRIAVPLVYLYLYVRFCITLFFLVYIIYIFHIFSVYIWFIWFKTWNFVYSMYRFNVQHQFTYNFRVFSLCMFVSTFWQGYVLPDIDTSES